MNTPSMFPLEDFEQQIPRNDRNETESEAGIVFDPPRTDDHNANGSQGSAGETASIYEANGITGRFELDSIAMVFPESPEDLGNLADNMEVNGMVEEPTLARTQGPGSPLVVVDGKRRIRAAEMAGVQITYRILCDDIDPRAYVWAKNSERRHLNASQKALAFAELFPKLPPGRPPRLRENCRNSDNFSSPTQGQGAKDRGVSRELINQAYKVVDPDRPVPTEMRDAVRNGILTIHDVLQDEVSQAAPETLLEALSQVKDGTSSTISRALDKLAEDHGQRDRESPSGLRPPTRLGSRGEFHCCSVDDLKQIVEPGTADLVIAHPPESISIGCYSHIAELSAHSLGGAGILVVAGPAGVSRRGILERLNRKERQIEFIAEFSLISPIPFADLGDPHYTRIRRVPLLVFGKGGARLPDGDDIIEVPDPARDMAADEFMEVNDCLPLVVQRFACARETVLFPTLEGSGSAVATALELGCTVVGADRDQSVIDGIMQQLSDFSEEPFTSDPDC